MGSLHQIPTAAASHARLLEQLISSTIADHADPEIAARWASMASVSASRFAGPPMPSQPVLDLDAVEGLSQEQREQLTMIVSNWLESYFNDVRAQLMNVHRDMLSLQKRVAELEVAMQRQSSEPTTSEPPTG